MPMTKSEIKKDIKSRTKNLEETINSMEEELRKDEDDFRRDLLQFYFGKMQQEFVEISSLIRKQ